MNSLRVFSTLLFNYVLVEYGMLPTEVAILLDPSLSQFRGFLTMPDHDGSLQVSGHLALVIFSSSSLM
jgi:hypothetical protein